VMITSGQSANRKFQKFPEDPEVVKDGFPREDRVLPRPKKREEKRRGEEVEGVKRVYEVWAAHSKLEEWAT
jgi:hypothetical protein